MEIFHKFKAWAVYKLHAEEVEPVAVIHQWAPYLYHLSRSWLFAAAAAKSLQSCPTLWDPIDSRPSGSPVPGILQARTLEWVAVSFSNAWKWKVKAKLLSHVWLTATFHPWDFPGKSTGVSCHCLLWLFAEYRIILNSNSCMKVKEEVENVLSFQTPISQEVSKTKLCQVTNLCHTLHRIWFEEIIYLNHNHCCLVTQLCPTLCDPMVLGYLSISMDYSPPGSSVHGIFSGKNTGVGCHFLLQGSSWPRDQTYVSCIGRWILYLGSPVIIIATFSREHWWSCQRFCLVKAG